MENTEQPIEVIVQPRALPIEIPFEVKRAQAYPRVQEQLDMLWHAMDLSPEKRLEPFYSAIKEIKEKIPK